MLPFMLEAQQLSDTSYNPVIDQPVYDPGRGPVIFIDEGHHNFHTKDGRYHSFAELLHRDGYRVQKYDGKFTRSRLDKSKILVISNALNEVNVGHWYLPTPSAFTPQEVQTVEEWVREGGCLFLIADHMPMAGASEDLAMAFGFEFTNGFAIDTMSRGPTQFTTKNGTLKESVITRGRTDKERVDVVVSFTGQAFNHGKEARPILVFSKNFVNMLPDTAWVFTNDTPVHGVTGWSQGAYKEFGKGKVVAFGEAAMFTAQLAGPPKVKMGMNHDSASQNYQLLLNVVHWLDGHLK